MISNSFAFASARTPFSARPFAGNVMLRRAFSPLALLALWQLGSSLGAIPARIIASPLGILATFWQLLVAGPLFGDLFVSLARVAVGVTIGVPLGIGFALLAGLSSRGDDLVDPPLQMLRAIPLLGTTPLLILWFGIGETPKIVLVALFTMFPIYVTLLGAIRNVDRKLLEMGAVYGLSRAALVRDVILPGCFPAALAGFRYALGVAWLSLVIGEQINADRGIGHLIVDARDFLRTDVIVVGLLVYAVLGLVTDGLVRILETRALAWRASDPAVAR